jgi:AcrR family transcriptional regulator
VVRETTKAARPGRRRAAAGPAVTRERIVIAAARLFQQRGYDRTSISSIADAVGVTAPALYWHFESKADILFEFLRTTLTEFTAEIEQQLVGVQDSADRLRVFAASHTRSQLRQFDKSLAYGELIFSASQLSRSLASAQIEELSALQRRHLALCREIVRAGIDAGEFDVSDPTVTAFAVLNICEHVNQWFNPDGQMSADDIAELHGELAVRLVQPGSAAGKSSERSERDGDVPERQVE